jgi:hypothetical protein
MEYLIAFIVIGGFGYVIYRSIKKDRGFGLPPTPPAPPGDDDDGGKRPRKRSGFKDVI